MDAMTRSSRFGWMLALGLVLACSERTVDFPEEQPGKLYCMVAADTWGHFADGTIRMVHHPNEHRNAAGCACVLPEERWADETLAMLNDLALEDCLDAVTHFDFEWDECQEDYEAGVWLQVVIHPETDDGSVYIPDDLHCADD